MVFSSIPYYYLYMQVQQSMDGLLKWLDETDRQQQNQARETISVEPDGVRDQLKKAKVRHRTVCREMLCDVLNYGGS